MAGPIRNLPIGQILVENGFINEKLLQEEKVAVVPGNAFGDSGEGFVRVSYAYSLKHLQEALRRREIIVNRQQGESK